MGRKVGGGAAGRGTHVHPWLIHVNVWQNPPQYCKAVSLQLKYINLKKKEQTHGGHVHRAEFQINSDINLLNSPE